MQLPKLEELRMSSCHLVDPPVWEYPWTLQWLVAWQFPRLRRLDLSQTNLLGQHVAAILEALPALEALNLDDHCYLTNLTSRQVGS